MTSPTDWNDTSRVAPNVGLVALRREPSRATERVSEALGGEPLDVGEVRVVDGDTWLRVTMPDRYSGWVPAEQTVRVDTTWPGPSPVRVGARETIVRTREGVPIRTWVYGGVLRREGRSHRGHAVVLPDGTPGEVPADAERPFYADDVHVGTTSLALASALLGTPYRWGGRTPSGVDCSGLVQMALVAGGLPAPRDSWQQEEWFRTRGDRVQRADLRPGDVIFWGEGERASHVGLALDRDRFIHARAWVRVGEWAEGRDADLADRFRAAYRARAM